MKLCFQLLGACYSGTPHPLKENYSRRTRDSYKHRKWTARSRGNQFFLVISSLIKALERALRKSLRNNEKSMGKPWEIPYKQWGFIEKSWTYMGKSLVKIVDSRLINDLLFFCGKSTKGIYGEYALGLRNGFSRRPSWSIRPSACGASTSWSRWMQRRSRWRN